jgi:hypothetical protein
LTSQIHPLPRTGKTSLAGISESAEVPTGLPPHYVAISHDGMEATFLLDTGSPELESPVVIFGPGWDFLVIAPDFNAFVAASFNAALRY